MFQKITAAEVSKIVGRPEVMYYVVNADSTISHYKWDGAQMVPALSASAVAAVNLGSLKRPNHRVAYFGDSRAQQVWATSLSKSIRSMGFWLEFLSHGRLDSIYSENFGVGGETSAQFLARVGAAAASSCAIAVVVDPTNDYGSIAHATTVANMEQVFTTLRNAGKLVIAWMPTPRGSPNTLDATGLLRQAQYGSWLKLNAMRLGINIADATSETYDSAVAGFTPKSGVMADGLHFGIDGAYRQAKPFVQIIDTLIPPVDSLVWNNADLYDATECPRGNLFANGLMTGSGGSTTAGGATVSGTWAASWSLVVTNGAGLTIVGSVTTFTDKYNKVHTIQQMAISGTPSAGNPTIALRQVPSSAYVAEGDVMEMLAFVQVAASSAGVSGLALQQWITDATGAHATRTGDYSSGVGVLNAEAYHGVLRSPPNTVGASPTQCYGQMLVGGTNGTAMSATVGVGNMSLKKI
jgi:lysophospholipase L1-like esterase